MLLGFAGESRRASHHGKRGRALGGVRRQGDPLLGHLQGLQEDALVSKNLPEGGASHALAHKVKPERQFFFLECLPSIVLLTVRLAMYRRSVGSNINPSLESI